MDVIAIFYHVERNVISFEGVQKAILKTLKFNHNSDTKGATNDIENTNASNDGKPSKDQSEEKIIPVASNDLVDVSVRIRLIDGSENNRLCASIILVNKTATQNVELGWTQTDWFKTRVKYDADIGEGMPLLKDSNGNFFRTNYEQAVQSFRGLVDSQGIQKRTIGPNQQSIAALWFDAIITGKQKIALTLPATLFTDSRGAQIFENDLVVVFNIPE